MLYKLSRLFVIKNKFEACAIIYAMALGAAERGKGYLTQYPGFAGKMLFCACFIAVLMAGAKILDGVRLTKKAKADSLKSLGHIRLRRDTMRRRPRTPSTQIHNRLSRTHRA
jgi:hypothetical protein